MTDTFGNRGTGRTTAIVRAAKDAIGRGVRVLIVGHNYEQARRIAEQVGSRAECVGMDLVGERMRGSDFVPFVDHNAVEMFASELGSMRSEVRRAKAQTAAAMVSVSEWRDRCGRAESLAMRAASRVQEMEDSLAALAAERDRWRARCPVTADDVEASGVTADQCEAFLLANGGHRYGGHVRFVVLAPHEMNCSNHVVRERWMEGSSDTSIAEACNTYALAQDKAPHDVLAEMLATEVKR